MWSHSFSNEKVHYTVLKKSQSFTILVENSTTSLLTSFIFAEKVLNFVQKHPPGDISGYDLANTEYPTLIASCDIFFFRLSGNGMAIRWSVEILITSNCSASGNSGSSLLYLQR